MSYCELCGGRVDGEKRGGLNELLYAMGEWVDRGEEGGSNELCCKVWWVGGWVGGWEGRTEAHIKTNHGRTHPQAACKIGLSP